VNDEGLLEQGVPTRNTQLINNVRQSVNLEWTTLENTVIQDFHSNTPMVTPSIANSNVGPS